MISDLKRSSCNPAHYNIHVVVEISEMTHTSPIEEKKTLVITPLGGENLNTQAKQRLFSFLYICHLR